MPEARPLRLQSAVDYLTTYGWAIIVITIALAFIYFYLQGEILSMPNRCTLSLEARCTDLALGSNSVASEMQIIIVNGQQYAVENAMITVNITNYGNYNANCNPYYVLPGGKILCTITGLPSMNINTGTSGYLLFNESVCTSLGTTSCTKYFSESFNGTYTTTTSPSIPSISCSMTANSVPASTSMGSSVTLEANVLFSGVSVPGVTVGFTSSSSNTVLSQSYALTNPNGTAEIIVTDPKAESPTITGNFITGCSATNTITFT